MKKTIISLLLAMTLILSMTVSVFAGNDDNPFIMARDAVEQVMSK